MDKHYFLTEEQALQILNTPVVKRKEVLIEEADPVEVLRRRSFIQQTIKENKEALNKLSNT